jgi:hypothetical protein
MHVALFCRSTVTMELLLNRGANVNAVAYVSVDQHFFSFFSSYEMMLTLGRKYKLDRGQQTRASSICSPLIGERGQHTSFEYDEPNLY